MPLSKKHEKLRRSIIKEYLKKGYSKKRATKIANSVIYKKLKL